MRDKAEPSLNASDPVGDKDFFLDHGPLLSVDNLIWEGREGARIHQAT